MYDTIHKFSNYKQSHNDTAQIPIPYLFHLQNFSLGIRKYFRAVIIYV